MGKKGKINLFNSLMKCIYDQNKKQTARDKYAKGNVQERMLFFFSHCSAVFRSITHAGSGYLINNTSCH